MEKIVWNHIKFHNKYLSRHCACLASKWGWGKLNDIHYCQEGPQCTGEVVSPTSSLCIPIRFSNTITSLYLYKDLALPSPQRQCQILQNSGINVNIWESVQDLG